MEAMYMQQANVICVSGSGFTSISSSGSGIGYGGGGHSGANAPLRDDFEDEINQLLDLGL